VCDMGYDTKNEKYQVSCKGTFAYIGNTKNSSRKLCFRVENKRHFAEYQVSREKN
jgi:hypothetical protein